MSWKVRTLPADRPGARAAPPGRCGVQPVAARSPQAPQDQPRPRLGSISDAHALVAMHGRCSAEVVHRRYHAPVSNVTPRMARALLAPAGGLSMVMAVGEDIVAAGLFCPDPAGADDATAELGLIVEDSWQRRGVGARLLRALAVAAADRGLETLTCLTQPDNDAVLRTIRRAGFRARATYADGLTEYRLAVGRLRDTAEAPGGRRGNRPSMDDVAAPLVALLHDRPELRAVYPPADLIDQAVRGGA